MADPLLQKTLEGQGLATGVPGPATQPHISLQPGLRKECRLAEIRLEEAIIHGHFHIHRNRFSSVREPLVIEELFPIGRGLARAQLQR